MSVPTPEKVTLPEVLGWLKADPSLASSATIADIDRIRENEHSLSKFLPGQIIRRISKGYSRSSTVNPDTAIALYSIVRAVKAKNVFETGTYWGYSTTYLAAAMRDNGGGVVDSFDIYKEAGRYIPSSFDSWVNLHLGLPATESMPPILAQRQPDVFFQDSVHDYDGVLAELKTAYSNLKENTIVLFHDFVEPMVVRAAYEGLPGFSVYQIDNSDPQILGLALKKSAFGME